MAKKYMSMQEELAARRAASESREISPDQGDLAASGHFERSSTSRGRSRYKALSGPGRRKALPGPNRYKRMDGSNQSKMMDSLSQSKLMTKLGQSRGLAGMSLMQRSIFVVIIAVVASAVIITSIAAFFLSYDQETEWSDPPEMSEEYLTEEAEEAGLEEYSSNTEIYSYVEERTEPFEDEKSLYGDTYFNIMDIVEQHDEEFNCFITNGRIYVSPTCSDEDDPAQLEKTWKSVSDEIQSELESQDQEEAPVIIMVHSESWRLRLLMIDGRTEYKSEAWEE